MKILSVTSLVLPDVKVVRFARFADHRGYFTEPFRLSEFDKNAELGFLRQATFVQMNESWSRVGVVRGLHFQWNPHVGKLARCVHGRMVDLFLDIRLESPTFGKIASYDMRSPNEMTHGEWIWLPPGFAHGTFFTEESRIEYLCTGEYNPACEAGISPLADDLDWSLCEPALKREFDELVSKGVVLSAKDREGLSLARWKSDPLARNFVHGQV